MEPEDLEGAGPEGEAGDKGGPEEAGEADPLPPSSQPSASALLSQSSAPTELLGLSFNQDGGCFAAGTSSGFRIYNCDPFKETARALTP